METNNEEKDNVNRVCEFEEASETFDEAQNPVASANADEASCDKLLNVTLPKVSVSRAGVEFACIEQMMLLKKMNPRRLKDKPTSKNDFYTHERKNCGNLIKLAWKSKGCLKSKPRAGSGSYHAAHAARHLENY